MSTMWRSRAYLSVISMCTEYNCGIWHPQWWYLQLWWNWLSNGHYIYCKGGYRKQLSWQIKDYTIRQLWMGYSDRNNLCTQPHNSTTYHFWSSNASSSLVWKWPPTIQLVNCCKQKWLDEQSNRPYVVKNHIQ